MFIAGLASADIVGTCERLEDPNAPVWSKVHLTNIEALGGGTLAYDENTDTIPRTSTSPSAPRPRAPPPTPATCSPPRCRSSPS
jgi:hypothetical protein